MIDVSRRHHRVLDIAEALFFRYGYSRVTTEEIAKTSGISKKTLYVLFPSKAEIITKACIRAARKTVAARRQLPFTEASFRQDMTTLINASSDAFTRFSTPLIEDLRTSEPLLHRYIERWRDRYMRESLTQLIADGQGIGAVRKDVNPIIAGEVLSRLTLATAHPDHRPKDYSLPRLSTVVHILLDGVIKPSA